jgi:hypothetical protein
MALPSSGTLSMNDIRVELGIPTQSPFSLSGATMGAYVPLNNCSPVKPNQTTPYQISEWYSYCHSCVCTEFCLSFSASCNDACSLASTCDGCSGPCEPYYSSCEILTSGCTLYTTSGGTVTAAGGYYSDGFSCFEVLNDGDGIITAVSTCPIEVTFNLCASTTPDGKGDIEVTATAVDFSQNPITVDTDVELFFEWVGDFSIISDSIIIENGQSCASSLYGMANPLEVVSTFDFNGSPSPLSTSTQNYSNGIADASNSCILGC